MLRRSFILVLLIIGVLSPAAFAKNQDIIKMHSDIVISGDMVVNDVVSIGGDVTVSGRVENNIVAVGGSVILKPKSYVGGEIVIVGGDIVKDPAAIIGEKVTQIYMPRFIPSITNFLKGSWIALWATISILALLGLLGLSVLLVALMPDHMRNIVSMLDRSFVSMFLWGLLWAILVVPVTVLLAISIVGIILIPIAIVLVGLASIIGYIAAAIFIGKKILASFKKIRIPFLDVLLGIVVLFLIGFLPVAGPLVKIFFLTGGFGAVLTSRFGTIK